MNEEIFSDFESESLVLRKFEEEEEELEEIVQEKKLCFVKFYLEQFCQ